MENIQHEPSESASRSVFRHVHRLIRMVEEALIAGGILMIAGLTIANAFSRTLFDQSLAFAEELSQFMIIFVTFIGLSYAAARGRHIRMTALYDQLGLKARKALMIVIAAGTALLMFALAAYSVRYIETVRSLGTVSPVLQVPLYLIYLAAPLGLVLAGIQYVMTVVRNLTEEDVYLSFEQKDEYEEPLIEV